MKASRLTDAQKAFIIKQGENGKVIYNIEKKDVVRYVMFKLLKIGLLLKSNYRWLRAPATNKNALD
ncbi:hypothetical protein [Kiloniella sp.]|uniref:hypothetical protein n=1 Tax=Kiloniella sp. TaxID=1938587 RepID=UPI003A8C9F0F